ncbi:MAG: formylglycine-generating enzyme family protein [Vicinamibacterales bacterium]
MHRRTALASAAVLTLIFAAGWALVRMRSDSSRVHWDDPVTGTRFRLLQPKTFMMGTPEHEALREAQEVLHEVRLTRGFYIAETEVTQAQWERVMYENPSRFKECGPDCPVERVNWFDVQRFLSRLNATAGGGFRLPTEAEWEFACRGISSMPFGNSRSLSSALANINGHFPYNAPRGWHRRTTTRVRTFISNWAGLFDMSGNVWEWVQDELCPYGGGPAVDPVGACGSGRQVIRGGSWAFDGGSARCGTRYWHRPEDLGYSIGFRLVHDLF